jgi:hydroxymethylglutaryl-CoA lyase/(R)-citramalyl-CoA lyase
VTTAVTICDVGPRDGLQNEPDVLAPALRAELCNRLAAAGLPRVEAVSFVRGDRVPQMEGAEAVVAGLLPRDGTVFAGLVLNERGYERLAAAGLAEAHLTLGATESFNRRNANRSVAESIEACRRMIERAHEDGRRATVTISVAFGCPFEGLVDPGLVDEIVGALPDADEHVLADTIGVAVPRQVGELVRRTGAAGVHLHDTRGTAAANALAALEAGATVLDASVGGLGGCPFAPRSAGNVATEDLVYLLEGEGVATGVDLDALIEVAHWLEQLLGRQLPGRVHRAGSFPSVGARGLRPG